MHTLEATCLLQCKATYAYQHVHWGQTGRSLTATAPASVLALQHQTSNSATAVPSRVAAAGLACAAKSRARAAARGRASRAGRRRCTARCPSSGALLEVLPPTHSHSVLAEQVFHFVQQGVYTHTKATSLSVPCVKSKAKALQRAVPFLFCVLTSIQGPPFSRALYSNTSGHAVAGMSAGVPKYVTINLGQLAERFSEGEEVSLATLKAKRVLNLSGKEAQLPLKVRPKPAV